MYQKGSKRAVSHSKHVTSCFYRLTCSEFAKRYVGLNGGNFLTRFSEPVQVFHNNSYNLKFCEHLLANQYSLGTVNTKIDL
jgi:hypothetical protein